MDSLLVHLKQPELVKKLLIVFSDLDSELDCPSVIKLLFEEASRLASNWVISKNLTPNPKQVVI